MISRHGLMPTIIMQKGCPQITYNRPVSRCRIICYNLSPETCVQIMPNLCALVKNCSFIRFFAVCSNRPIKLH
jgi:hypothetical protein